jgi:hypothetical protein
MNGCTLEKEQRKELERAEVQAPGAERGQKMARRGKKTAPSPASEPTSPAIPQARGGRLSRIIHALIQEGIETGELKLGLVEFQSRSRVHMQSEPTTSTVQRPDATTWKE